VNRFNRALEALATKYGPSSINDRIHELDLKNTSVFPGCKQPPSEKDWTFNRTTLVDLGWLFEGVDTKQFSRTTGVT